MADQYDAFETDERPRTDYMSRKDWKFALVGLCVMSVILWPIYKNMERAAQNRRCVQNFQQMKNAMFVYMASNNDRFPPAFVEDENREPIMFKAGEKKAPHTWMTLIQGGMETRSSFVCPAAGSEELAQNLHPDKIGETFGSSYGMYLPRAGWPQSMIQSPEMSILVTETANKGAGKTFDPSTYSVEYDGITIGWNDGNTKLTKESDFATRLAFYETAAGRFKPDGPARHDHGLNVLFTSGRLGRIKSADARVNRLGEQSTGLWADR